jgi:hypothetical protein
MVAVHAVYVVSQHLIVDNILRGLKSTEPKQRKLALQRITVGVAAHLLHVST